MRIVRDNDTKYRVSSKITRLPSTYQEVEYIESTGTQYIDTGFTFNNINDIKMKLNFSSLQMDDGKSEFGANANSGEVLLFYGSTSNRIYLNGTALTYTPSINTDYDIDLNITNGNASLTINSQSIGTSTGNSVNKKCYLFGAIGNASSSVISNYSNYKLYYFKLYDSTDTLVMDLVPCYRKTDSVAGLYDLENDYFYTNDGTGEFTVGADISRSIKYKIQGDNN